MKRTSRTFAIVIGILSVTCAATALAASQVFQVDRKFYPYYPSLVKWEKTTAEFTPPDVCGGCHEKQYKEWTGSVHHLAFRTRYIRAN